MKVKLLILLILTVFSIACSESPKELETLNYKWEKATFSESDIDETIIISALQEAEKLSFLYSIVIIRNGKIVTEKYFNGHAHNISSNIRSVSKSFLSAALGIAVDNRVILLNDKLTDIVDEYNSIIQDVRFYDITTEHLMTMKAGLDRDVNIYSAVYNSQNWLSTIFNMTLINNPGEIFTYSTPGTHLLSAMFTNATGISTYEFMNTYLLKKIGIGIDDWERDPQGIFFGGNSMYFTTRNMAVLGLLFLNKGFLNNRQVISESWIEKSLYDHTGGIGDWGVIKNIGYGYLWWLGEINNYDIFTAIGHGGQFVLCIPELELIVATNAKSNISWEKADQQELAILDIIGNLIIPAVKGSLQ